MARYEIKNLKETGFMNTSKTLSRLFNVVFIIIGIIGAIILLIPSILGYILFNRNLLDEWVEYIIDKMVLQEDY